MIFVHDTPTNRLLNMVLGGGSPVAEYTATGNPLVFQTDLARPLKSLLIPFTPQQSGTGDPSPENIRSILPWNGLTVFGGGKNLLDGTIYRKNVDYNTGEINTSTNRLITDYLPLKAGKYTFSLKESAQITVYFYKEPMKSGYVKAESLSSWVNTPRTFTITEDRYVVIVIRNPSNTTILPSDVSELQLEMGSTATAYEPYAPITDTDIVFPSPVYGGTLDVVSGVLTVTHAFWSKNTADMNSTAENYPGWLLCGIKEIVGSGLNATITVLSNICTSVGVNTSRASDTLFLSKAIYGKTKEEWVALAIDVQVVAELATPLTYQLTPQQVTALIGNNTIWSDADGSMTAVYFKKG